MKPCPGFLIPALALLFASRVPAQIVVTTTADENNVPAGAQTSLREAIRDIPNVGTITFDPALNGKTLWLSLGEMVVSGKSVTVIAPPGFVIGAGGPRRIFRVDAGAGLSLSGATLQDGYSTSDGGAIQNAGTLSLTDCVLRDNRVPNGLPGTTGAPGDSFGFGGAGGTGGTGSNGGAISSTGSVTASRCYFFGNKAGNGGMGGTGGALQNPAPPWDGGPGGDGGQGGHGGAIYSSGFLQLTECVFEQNQSGAGGNGGDVGVPRWGYTVGGRGGHSGNGGAVAHDGDCTIERCTFFSNSCPPGGFAGPRYADAVEQARPGSSGSGCAFFRGTGQAMFINCSFVGNSTGFTLDSNHGGVVASGPGGSLHLVHCTITDNNAQGSYWKGYAYVGTLVETPTTAGIASGAAVQCSNCIISRNYVTRHLNTEEINFYTSSAPLVIPFGPFGGTPGGDAMLSGPALTSGLLPVWVPAPTSPVVDAGALISTPLPTDQRGLPRIGVPDLGAVELQPVEPARRGLQRINFSPPGSVESATVNLSATTTSTLPVSFEVAGGPASVSGNVLTFSSSGTAFVRAMQPGDANHAPALPVVRRIVATVPHVINFAPLASYTVYPGSQSDVPLPATTSAGLPVSWSFVNPRPVWAALNGYQLTVTGAGSVQIRGQNAGGPGLTPINTSWTLTFVQGTVWWDTPAAPGGGPRWFTLVEGSPHGLTMTASINAPHSNAVAVPAIPGVTATPPVIPAGQTSVTCLLTVPANPSLANHRQDVPTGNPAFVTASLFLVNRNTVPLDIFPPARVIAGVSVLVDVSCPGVLVPGLFGPPPHLGARTLSVRAADNDNPTIFVPVTLDSQANDSSLYPRKKLRVTFPSVNRRVRLTVATDDGITGHAGPIQIFADTNADGDGVNDVVEAALQRAPDQFHSPPLVIQQNNDGLRAVLGSRPVNLQGWSVVIELSTDLQSWAPAPAGSLSVTPNPDGTTETVAVLLPPGQGTIYTRLRASLP